MTEHACQHGNDVGRVLERADPQVHATPAWVPVWGALDLAHAWVLHSCEVSCGIHWHLWLFTLKSE